MTRKLMEAPTCILRMGKAQSVVKVTIGAQGLAFVEFDEHVVRQIRYHGRVTLRLEGGHFTAKIHEHCYEITRIDQAYKVDGVSNAAKRTILEEASAVVNELHAKHPEVFLDARIVEANNTLVHVEEKVLDAEQALRDARNVADGRKLALETAKTARRNFRKA